MDSPEKRISEMNRNGYRHYLGTEISRYLINQYAEYCKQPKKFNLANAYQWYFESYLDSST